MERCKCLNYFYNTNIMPISFIPGNKSARNNNIIQKMASCSSNNYVCFQSKVIKTNNSSDISNAQRISNLLTNNYSGRIQYGNNGTPLVLNYLGKVNGQSGGSGRPIRNAF